MIHNKNKIRIIIQQKLCVIEILPKSLGNKVFSCNVGSVSVTSLEYGNETFNYGSGTDLLESNVELDLDSFPGTESDPQPEKTTYYGLGVPAVAVGGACNGSIVITAQSDPHND